VYEQLNAEGVRCDMVTGQEVLRVPGSAHAACTVEMVGLSRHWDVAVIDEIQVRSDRVGAGAGAGGGGGVGAGGGGRGGRGDACGPALAVCNTWGAARDDSNAAIADILSSHRFLRRFLTASCCLPAHDAQASAPPCLPPPPRLADV
jgi:hypothetical protein